MKAKRTLLVAGLFVALQATAAAAPTNSVLSASIKATTKTNTQAQVQAADQPKLEPTYSTTQYKLVPPTLTEKEAAEKDKIIRIGKESSRAWTTIVSEQPNPTMVHNLSTHEPRFCICSFGQTPWPWR